MTSLDVSTKDVFVVLLALALITLAAFIGRAIVARIGRVWRGEKGPAFGWSELGLSGAILVLLGVLPALNLYVERDVEPNHLYDFRSLSGAHHWSVMLAHVAVASFGLGLGGLGVVLGIVSLVRRPKE